IRIASHDTRGRTGTFMGRYPMLTYPLFEKIREREEGFDGLAAFGTTTLNMAQSGEVRNATGMWVSGDFFATLGVRPLLGRLLGPGDDRRGCGGAAEGARS